MNYNARYSAEVPIKLGDLEQINNALSVAGDYLLWLTAFRGIELPGALDVVCASLARARPIANDLLSNGLDRQHQGTGGSR